MVNKKYGPNFQFKGQVKIEDVSKQLGLLTDGINSMIDTYNDAGYVTDIDLNDVSPELSPMDYTLSVGGLKKVLDAYDNTVIGCNVFTDSKKENLYISPGLLITRNKGYGLPSAVIKNEGQTAIWYSPSLNKYKGSAASVNTVSEFKMPTITSNESWGKINLQTIMNYRGRTYNWNTIGDQAQKAFNGTNSTGVQYACLADTLDTRHLYWTWENWPKPVNLTKVQWTLDYLQGSHAFINPWTALEVKEGSQWKTVVKGHEVGIGTQTYSLNNVTATGIRITLDWDRYRYPSGSLKNISISGTAESSTPVGGGATTATDWIKVATLNHGKEGILNTYEFKIGIPNMRIAAGAKSSVNMSTLDSFSDYKAKDLFVATPRAEEIEGNFGIYSKIYAPNRGSSQELNGHTRIVPFRIKNL